MNPKKSMILFLVVAILELLSELMECNLGIYLSKPLLLPLLFLFFASQTKMSNDRFKYAILVALVFSWIGDVLLMGTAPIFFMPGLAAFFIAQLSYLIAFSQGRNSDQTKSTIFDLILVSPLLIYFFFLMLDLIPSMRSNPEHLDLIWPVLIYGLVITGMSVKAATRYQRTNKSSYIFILVGALLFLGSDSILALNKFSMAIPRSGVYIMLTYISAQFLIVQGAVKYYSED